MRGIRTAILDGVLQLALGVEIEGRGYPSARDDDDAAGAQGVTNPQFVRHVRVLDREVRYDQVGDEQLLEHIGDDVAGPYLAIGTKRLEPCQCQRWGDVLRVDAVEVDQIDLGVRVSVGRSS